MEDNNLNGHYYSIFESDTAAYIETSTIIKQIKNFPYFEINNNNQMSFYEDLKTFVKHASDSKKFFIIININNISMDNQKRLSYMVKDKTYQTLSLPDNCKIIVTGNKDSIDKELFGLLVIIDVMRESFT